MADKRDYYEILGVPRDADSRELKESYRRLAKKLHPDVSQDDGAEARFKEINEAYSVLSDSEKRASYDRYGHEGLRGMGGMDFSGGFPFDDIFDQFFGGFSGTRRGGSRGPRRGPALDLQLRGVGPLRRSRARARTGRSGTRAAGGRGGCPVPGPPIL